jgi:hypothetical protein
MSKDFANMVPKVLCWLSVDVTSMHGPCLGYKQQNHTYPHRVEMASAAMIYFGLDPGKCVCFLAGDDTGHHQDFHRTLDTVKD